jgi:calcium-translocating P-type ATPase
MREDVRGLNTGEIEISREKYGSNKLEKEKSKGFFRRFLENLNDPIIKILIIALCVELIFTFKSANPFEILGIVAAILIATTVSTVSELGSEHAFLKMQEQAQSARVRVFRNGVLCEISSDELVVGDVMKISAGEKIEADGKIIDGEIKVDQSALNGESREVSKKSTASNNDGDLSNPSLLFRGSIVTHGEALVRVVHVGKNTYYGMVARDVQVETRESPLKIRLAKLASDISKIGYVMAALVGVLYLWNSFVAENGYIMHRILESIKNIPFVISTLSHALTLMITVIVVAAPEGLPMMITVVLCANMKRMMRDGVLVKKLVGIETAGSLNILFTDKTGTLTVGKLECDKIVSNGVAYSSPASLKKNMPLYTLVLKNAYYNTSSRLCANEIIGGNSTETALLSFVKGERCPKESVSEYIAFTSEKKYSYARLDSDIELLKGAPEVVLPKCSCMLTEMGIEQIDTKNLINEYEDFANVGNRVIAFAYREKGKNEYVFCAYFVLKDRVRAGVRDAVKSVHGAGVQVVMMTGDGKETARSIARECGILSTNADEIVLTSDELSAMSDEQIKEILPKLRVLARALPQDKTRLVRISQECDLVVGMTGDGINDAPSLKLSDVGFGMGNGEDIAKNASDIILLNNSFLSINKTILYGRTIFKSIRKFITFQLIMNIAACGVSIFGQFIGIESPITIIQMLWVNIIMDTLGALAFSGEAPMDYYMREAPKTRREPILTKEMLSRIFFDGGFTLVLSIMFLRCDFFKNMFRKDVGEIYLLTAFYALFIFIGIFNCFLARCERLNVLVNIGKNKLFIFIMILIAVIQTLMIYYGGTLFRTIPLLVRELISVILIAFSVVPFEIIRRSVAKLF